MIDSAQDNPFLAEVRRLTERSRDIQFRRAGAAVYSQRYEDLDVEARLDLAKAQALDYALESQCLGICSGTKLPFGDPPHGSDTLPIAILVPQFQNYEYKRSNDDFGQWITTYRISQILMLCPDHLNESTDHIQKIDERGVVSPIEKRAGKLIAVNSLKDVTAIPVVRRYHPKLYKEFGIESSYRRKLFGKSLNSHEFLQEILDPTDLSEYVLNIWDLPID